MRLFASTVMTSRSSSDWSAFALACGRFTSTPCVSIGAVTMKMMRRTSMTSTSGVTLMSAIMRRPPPFPFENAIALHPVCVAFEEVDELDGEAFDPRGDHPDPVQEVVVGHRRRDRRGEAGRGRDQRLGDAGGDRGEARAPHRRDAREGVH